MQNKFELIFIVFCSINLFTTESSNSNSGPWKLNTFSINSNQTMQSDSQYSSDSLSRISQGLSEFNLNVNSSQFVVHDNILFTCQASRLNYTRLEWYFKSDEKSESNQLGNSSKMTIINSIDTRGSTIKSTLLLSEIDYDQSGAYYCTAMINLQAVKSFEPSISTNYSELMIKIDVQPIDKYRLKFRSNMKGQVIYLPPSKLLESYILLHCNVEGDTPTEFVWYINGKEFKRDKYHGKRDFTESFLIIRTGSMMDLGEYKCETSNGRFNASAVAYLSFPKESHKGLISLLIITSLIFALALCITVCIVVKYCKAKHLQYLTSNLLSPMSSFNSFNPDVPLDEQVDLLSYDSNWEFPPDRLKIIRTLGEGAFGRVVLAQITGLNKSDKIQFVAVKMLKPNADFLQIKALISELKILIHMGHHLNIVNCLGAVTKDRTHDKLMVIVEYCQFGNLRNFLRERRKLFVDQIDLYDQNDECTKDGDLSKLNKHDSYVEPHNLNGNSCSSNNNNDSGNCSNSTDERRAFIKEDKPDSDVNFNGNGDERLATCDLIAIAFQVARGMEYLQQKKLIHRDLAARNVLVADKRVVKICDFGLTKDIQKDYNYIKKVDTPLPIKWMAIESIGDRVYTTQSDVWSFGILLWEIFTLGRSPYPGLPVDQDFYQKLVKGYRMERPDKCPKAVYKIMTDCWLSIPNDRPNFTQLVDRLSEIIDDSIRDYYIELDTAYQNNEFHKNMRGNVDVFNYTEMDCSFSNSKPTNKQDSKRYMSMSKDSHHKKIGTKPVSRHSSHDYNTLENKENTNPMEVVPMIYFDMLGIDLE